MQATVADGVETMDAVRLTVPAKPEYITLGRLALAGLALLRPEQFSPEVLGDVKLALTEACTNSVRHAYGAQGGSVAITYELYRDRLVIEVVDEGGGFEPGATAGTAAPEPLPGDDELSVGGLGLAIIDAISDELAITKGGSGGSTLRFVKHLS
jgi:serine/threonine-protein kinase RsbW